MADWRDDSERTGVELARAGVLTSVPDEATASGNTGTGGTSFLLFLHPKLLKKPGFDDDGRKLGPEGSVTDPNAAEVYVFGAEPSAVVAGRRVDCVVAIAFRSLLSWFHGSRPSTALELERRVLTGELPVVERRELLVLTAESEWLLSGVGIAVDTPPLGERAA
jgi:hypothetical protein